MDPKRSAGNMWHVNINQLRAFYITAKAESITKAAAVLCVTPGAVTSQIKQLEEQMGVRLIDRTGKYLHLTDSGADFYEKVRSVFEQMEELEACIRDIADKKSGILTIGCSETAAIYVLPKLIKEFKKIYPGIKVVIDRGPSEEVFGRLLSRKNELAVARYQPDEKRFRTRYMGRKEIVLVAAKESQLLSGETVSPQQLSEVPLIVPIMGSATRSIVREYFMKMGITPRILMESSNIALIKEFTRGDEGVGFFCRDAVSDELANGIFKEVHIPECNMIIEYGIAYLNRSDLSQAALAFLKIL